MDQDLFTTLSKIEAERKFGAIGDFEAKTKKMQAYTDQLAKWNQGSWLQCNPSKRNQLEIEVAASNGDLGGVMEAYAKTCSMWTNYLRLTLILGMEWRSLVNRLKWAWVRSLIVLVSLVKAIANSSGIIGEIIQKFSSIGGAISKVMMGIASEISSCDCWCCGWACSTYWCPVK